MATTKLYRVSRAEADAIASASSLSKRERFVALSAKLKFDIDSVQPTKWPHIFEAVPLPDESPQNVVGNI